MGTFSEANNTNLLSGGAGNNTIQGSTGQDWVDYSGKSGDYRIDRINGDWIVTDTNLSDGDDGRDVLRNVKGVRFANGQLEFGTQTESEFLVNSYTAGNQGDSSITGLKSGGFVLTWSSSAQDGRDGGVYGQLYNAQGQKQGLEFRVNAHTDGSQVASTTVALADGGFAVSWMVFNEYFRGWEIYAQRYNARGQAQGEEFRVNTNTTSDQMYPNMSALSDGGFVVTWGTLHEGNSREIHAQRYNAQGQTQGAEFRIDNGAFTDHYGGSITSLADGGFVVAWLDWGDYGGAPNSSFAQRYNAQGQTQGSVVSIVDRTQANWLYEPQITGLVNGGFLATWVWQSREGLQGGIKAQIYNDQGQAQGYGISVATNLNVVQSSPCIAALQDGGFVIAWTKYLPDYSNGEIYAQRYNAQGQTKGPEFLVNSNLPDTQGYPSIATLSDGSFVVSWTSQGQGSRNNDVFARHYDASGEPISQIAVASAGVDSLNVGVGFTARGGQGDDVYLVSDAMAQIAEEVDQGVDTVNSSFSWVLGSNLENLTLIGAGSIEGVGNELNNVIEGNAGNNVLDGADGKDTLKGGLGDDTYVVDTATDVIVEKINEGFDTVQSSVGYTLGSNVENLTLTGSNSIYGNGNELNNIVVGNASNNVLNGGAGNDTLKGGAGDDVYVVDTTTDVIIERLNEGQDTVQSSVSYVLGSNLENLTLTGTGFLVNGTGNELNNLMLGNSSNNVLDGGAGNDTLDGRDGIDTLKGGLGDDVYVVDTATDVIVEKADEGLDVVQSSVSIALAGNLENLTLTGDGPINGTGNQLNNMIVGNAGSNVLMGGGGNDTLDGGQGQDWVEYRGQSADYRIDRINGDWIVTDTNLSDGDDGRDVLRNVEGLRFANKQFQLAVNPEPRIKVNSDPGYKQSMPRIAGLVDGGYVVVWNDYSFDGSKTGIHVRRYNALGQPQGSELEANTYKGSNKHWDAQVAGTRDGGFVVTWVSYGQDGDLHGIFAQRYSVNGLVQGLEFQVNTYTLGRQFFPNVTGLSDGGFVVSWMSEEQDGSRFGIYAQRYNAQGQSQGGEFRVNSYTNFDQYSSCITALSDGGFVVSWVSDFQNGSGCAGIYARRYSSKGEPTGPEFRINDFSTSSRWDPSITALNDGGFVVSWTADDPGWQVYAKRYNAQGQEQGAEFKVSGDTYSYESRVTALADGGFVIVWRSNFNLLGGMRYNAQGQAQGPLFGAGLIHLGNSRPDVTALADGGFVVTCGSVMGSTDGGAINTQRFNASGEAATTIVLGTPEADTINVGLGYVAKGGAGDDVYLISDSQALIAEDENQGIDTVKASASWKMSNNLENLTLTGNDAINGTGNALNNVIEGNNASNVLQGGKGADTLIGGAGSDVYVFSKYDGVDTIIETDTSDIDTLQLSDITKSELLFARIGQDLEIKVINTNDRITIKDWALKNKETLQIKTADGLVLSSRAIKDIIAENKTLKVSYIAGTNSAASKYLGYFKKGDVVKVTTEFKARSKVSGMVFLGDAGGEDPYNNFVNSGPVHGNGEWQTITQTLTMNSDDHVWVYVYGDRDGEYKAAGNAVEYDNLVASSLQQGVVLDDRMDSVTQSGSDRSKSDWHVGGRIEQAGPGAAPQNATLELSYVAGTNSSASKFLGSFKVGDVVTVTVQFRAQSNVSGMVFLGDSTGNYSNIVSSGPVYGNGDWQTITQTLTMNGNDDVSVYLYGDRDGAYRSAGNSVEYDNLVVSSLQQGVVLDDRMDVVSEAQNLLSKSDWYVSGQIEQLKGVYASDNQSNVLVGGSRTDFLDGGVGNDTYVINRNGGLDYLYDLDTAVGNTDVLSFGTGITADQLWFSRTSADGLGIGILGTNGSTIIQNWYRGNQFQIEQIKVGDKTLLNTDVENLVQAMAAFSVPASGESTLPTSYQPTLSPVIAANWR